ncbi:hypothetical protein BO94DRAFT_192315 [Aspergillus sclerotioniger CBS 115572]|uniref:C2H2-type domain-containing protein n=1 Tax=Aspergillus sclerotioniger CBS 115572 TaxID=1450535 RepID=A0A317VUY8_9EURO|nr:hypothetical protein BO94DRAFT_192315 [Aspergillus sclerotioniger CBS 115572]PWY77171.1 hypothetical protein BO94DRAFT_192315 [Aspergillus sclerotioniger CBS 115572]
MAALMQSNNEPVTISKQLSGTSNSIISAPSEPLVFLKQSRPDSSLTSIASAGLNVSRSGVSLPPMTTAAPPATAGQTDRPLEHEKESEQHSSQVAREALGATEKQANPVNETLQTPSDQMQVDPHSGPGTASDAYGAADNNATLIDASTVASPGPIEDTGSPDGGPRHRDEGDIPQETGNKAFSYPMPTVSFNDPRRGLSLPGSGFHKGQRSPSAKKHRCPYCATEFTRHHNLKSHLLTHSQEKPYVCSTCQSRFRRLHDLKRHTKLHTGERPHICPKCGRRFARGDALARHNKGQGGCAGRRASMGSYVPEDEYGDPPAPGGADDTMDGLVYTAEPERMDEEEERGLMPSIKKHDVSTDSISRSNTAPSYQTRQPSTYPPIASSRPSPGGLFPPPSHAGSSASTSPISQSGNMTFPPPGQPSGSSVFPTNITGSPKPLSPHALSSHQLGHGPENNVHHRAHSTGMAQSFQQQPFNRAGPSSTSVVGNHAASGLGLPPPQPGAPQLPPPPGMSSAESRFALHSQGSVPPAPSTATKHTPSHSHPNSHSGSLSSKPGLEGASNNGNQISGPHESNLIDQLRDREDKLWTYIRSVHEELNGLRTEVAALRAQIASTNVNALAMSNPSAPQAQTETSAVGTSQR